MVWLIAGSPCVLIRDKWRSTPAAPCSANAVPGVSGTGPSLA